MHCICVCVLPWLEPSVMSHVTELVPCTAFVCVLPWLEPNLISHDTELLSNSMRELADDRAV